MSTLEAALEWASKGRPVFPCGKDKRPLTQNGFKNATTNPSVIRSMWAEHPDAMIGIATGSTSGLIVLDFDVDSVKGVNAMGIYDELRLADLIPEDTLTIKTPRGGLHVYLEGTAESVKSAAGYEGRAGFDIRAEGGYVIAPPSVSATGEYQAIDDEAEIQPAPPDLIQFLTRPRSPAEPTGSIDKIFEGQRNQNVFRRASFLRGKGLTPEEVAGAALAFNAARCQPPLPESEVLRIAQSVSDRYEPNDEAASSNNLEDAWKPIPIGDIDAGDSGESVWGQLLIKGGITLFSAREKVGKTTLCCMLINEAGKEAGGELLGQPVSPSRVLVVSEESSVTWERRRDDEGLPENLLVIPSPAYMPTDLATWREACELVARLATEHAIDLVVFDTWAAFAPVESENNNAEVHRAAQGFRRISEAGVSVLVFHHMAKAGGTRGGTALPAAADVIVEMKRPESSHAESDLEDDGVRVFKCTGRYDTPSRITAVWNGSGYSLDGSGSSKNLKVKRRHDALRETIHRAGSDVALKDIRNHWLPDGVRLPSDKTLRRDLEELVRAGEILQTGGTGGAQDPRRYSIPAATRLIP